ncbi:hypothetical protein ACFQDG_13050 [Natronoarchaeum mannanilyticum]|uniref:PKD domain-containing protein n=1 Tax=Natronoarchaeum mannanilyticum TaxID=926360 RepID=A0AAV3T9W3_9EURY
MRRRSLLAAASAAATAGIAGCTDSESTGVEVLDRELTEAVEGEATMRVRVENGGDGGHVEVAVDLAWTTGEAEGEVFETYSDVVGLDAGERRWVDVSVRRYPDQESDYEYRLAASRTDRPLARFAYDPESPAVGDVVRFDAGPSRVVDGAIAAFDWSIGDAYGVGREIEYRLEEESAEGLSVELRVTDTQGKFDTARRRIDPEG